MLKIDYRFREIPYGLEVDDAEYYYSAVTIGIDFDLDFSNQMEGVENRYLNQEEKKVVPFHPIGSGILASPFVFIANIFQKVFQNNGLISFVYFSYSIAPLFYLFLSILLIQSSMKALKDQKFNLVFASVFCTQFKQTSSINSFALEKFFSLKRTLDLYINNSFLITGLPS